MNSLTIKVYIASGYSANKGKLILNNVEYSFDNVMPKSDNAYELFFGFANPITLPVTGQLFIINASDDIVPFDHNGTIQVNQGYAIYNYYYNNPCYMEFELEEAGQAYVDPSIEFGSVSNPWYYNQYQVSTCNQPSYYELKCGFNYGGSVRPAKTFIRWGTNEPYTQITYGGVNPEYFSWQEQSVPSGEIGTLVVEFTDANDIGLTVDSYSSQDYVFDTDTAGSYGGTRLLIKSPDDSNIYDYSAGNFIECNVTLSAAPEPPQPATYTVTVNVTGQGTVSGAGTYEEGTSTTLTPTPASGWRFDHWHDNDNNQDYYSNPLFLTVRRDLDITAIFIEGAPSQPDLTGRYYFDSTNNYVIYFTNNQSLVYGPCGEGTSYWFDWGYTDHWILQVIIGGNYENFDYDENNDVFEYNGAEFTYSSTDPCGGPGPQPTEKHIYLCDNSGAHLAEMINTSSTWSVSGAFTSGMYSIRATVEGEYDDAWFKFYQTSGDNRVFVGAGDDPSFEDLGTYIMIDDILTTFSLVEDQVTGYYVVNYQNTGAMTVSMVDTIVNSYIGDFVTGDEISAMGYMTATDISAMGYMTQTDISSMSYITMTDIQALGYLTQTDIDNMSYITMTDIDNCSYATESYVMEKISEIQPGGDTSVCVKYADLNVYAYVSQPALSAMSYVDNSYLSTYMNNVVGNIESILQTI